MPIQGPLTTIVSTDALAGHIGDLDWAIVDCRFDLQNPLWGIQDYLRAHIPGAFYADLNNDLSGPIRVDTGRHPLPSPANWQETLGKWGIGDRTQVIAYDTAGGAFAARLWWMLRWIDHPRVAVLDGGFQKWVREERPVENGLQTPAPGQFTGDCLPGYYVTLGEVEQIRKDPHYRLVDARSPERFRGEAELIDPVAGHIPGAVNRFHGANLSPEGTFLSPEELSRQFRSLLGEVTPDYTIVYCGSGVTSCHHLLAMEIAGLPGARLYPGSWSEWIRDPGRPIEIDE